MTLLIVLASILISSLVLANQEAEDPCAKIEKAFVEGDGNKPICQCLSNPATVNNYSRQEGDSSGKLWIGCTRQKMPAVFRSLLSLNNTQISHLHIWDSLINILPNEMFAKIRPERLTIEASRVGVIRKEAFTNIEYSLKELSLKNNILKNIDEKAMARLNSLTSLDLSGNKLAEIKNDHLLNLTKLETLMLNSNQLTNLEDGLFQTLGDLKILNLANNRIRRIKRNTFKGLENLEVLNLRDNRIEHIDEHAFDHLKALKILDIAHNNFGKLRVDGNVKLERLVLSNNSIATLADFQIANLPELKSLHMDCNKISAISDNDLLVLQKSPKLVSLTLDGNNISWIGCGAFEPVGNLVVLSLQRNKIASLSCSSTRDPSAFSVYLDRSVLEPLKSLRTLLLSYNNIVVINDDDLTGLESIRNLALDHNLINKVAKNSFDGLKLKKLFLNNNHLYYLPRGIFDGWNFSYLQAVDISENNWECICEQEWIGAWLAGIGSVNTPSGTLGCLIGKCEKAPPGKLYDVDVEGHELWIRIAACILAFVAILFLIIAGYVYVQESRYSLPIKRSSSDTIRLIPSQENLFSFPNPIMVNDTSKQLQQHKTPTTIPPLSIQSSTGKVIVEGEETKRDRKKVRFNE